MNLEFLLLSIMVCARRETISHYDLAQEIIAKSQQAGEPMMICEAWDLIEDAKNSGYIQDEWFPANVGGTLWHLTETGKARHTELELSDPGVNTT